MRRCNWLAVSILATLCVAFYFGWLEPRKRHQEFCRSVGVELSTLAQGRRATSPGMLVFLKKKNKHPDRRCENWGGPHPSFGGGFHGSFCNP